jgi:hypothetical protein
MLVDARGVRRDLANGQAEQVAGEGRGEVAVLKTGSELPERLPRLPGFNHAASLRVMRHGGDAAFVCGRRGGRP